MAISSINQAQYDAIAKVRADIVQLLDEAFGANYVVDDEFIDIGSVDAFRRAQSWK